MEGMPSRDPGGLLATIQCADTRWFPGDWTKALYIYERCLVFSKGPGMGELYARAFAANQFGATSDWYDARLALDAASGPELLATQHPNNWLVWSDEVAEWELRPGIGASRLRLTLADGSTRKVLWGRISNSLPPIRSALERSLDASGEPRTDARRSVTPTARGFGASGVTPAAPGFRAALNRFAPNWRRIVALAIGAILLVHAHPWASSDPGPDQTTIDWAPVLRQVETTPSAPVDSSQDQGSRRQQPARCNRSSSREVDLSDLACVGRH